jgi:methylamine---glutamate N-methyltransferase subunit C
MTSVNDIDYGPLAALIGTWRGDRGMDVAPDSAGTERSPYFETIEYVAGGEVSNAKTQTLKVVRYHQVVRRKSNGEVFHDQIGFWLWDAQSGTLMHSLVVPRGLCVLAGGTHAGRAEADGSTVLEVAAAAGHGDWGIVQSPFMQEKARTTAFRHRIAVNGNTMHYAETTVLDIYGRVFDHTDENTLERD